MQIDPISTRKALRSKMKKRRQLLSQDEIKRTGQLIARALDQLNPVREAKTIMCFQAIQNEVDLGLFMQEQLQKGKKILLPRVEGDRIVAVQWQGEADCQISSFGISEPIGEAYPAEEIDVVLVPGLVFDARGYRLGYGKGYYDRFLPLLRSNAFQCGVAYEFQIVDNVFPHERDVPVHWIVTEQSEVLVDADFF